MSKLTDVQKEKLHEAFDRGIDMSEARKYAGVDGDEYFQAVATFVGFRPRHQHVIRSIRKAHEMGLNYKEAIEKVGVNCGTIDKYSKLLGINFPKTKGSRLLRQTFNWVVKTRRDGHTLEYVTNMLHTSPKKAKVYWALAEQELIKEKLALLEEFYKSDLTLSEIAQQIGETKNYVRAGMIQLSLDTSKYDSEEAALTKTKEATLYRDEKRIIESKYLDIVNSAKEGKYLVEIADMLKVRPKTLEERFPILRVSPDIRQYFLEDFLV